MPASRSHIEQIGHNNNKKMMTWFRPPFLFLYIIINRYLKKIDKKVSGNLSQTFRDSHPPVDYPIDMTQKTLHDTTQKDTK